MPVECTEKQTTQTSSLALASQSELPPQVLLLPSLCAWYAGQPAVPCINSLHTNEYKTTRCITRSSRQNTNASTGQADKAGKAGKADKADEAHTHTQLTHSTYTAQHTVHHIHDNKTKGSSERTLSCFSGVLCCVRGV
jgi:hypothetical protein